MKLYTSYIRDCNKDILKIIPKFLTYDINLFDGIYDLLIGFIGDDDNEIINHRYNFIYYLLPYNIISLNQVENFKSKNIKFF